MRRVLTFVLGVVIGQWLVFGAVASPADYHIRAQRAWQARDYLEAMQLWSQAAALQPADPTFHYYRGTALARLGLKLSAIDAFQMALLSSFLPTMMLSGFVYPIASMPAPIRAITYLVPARYFLVALRSIVLKGAGIRVFWMQLVALTIYATFMLMMAARRLTQQWT